jgi:hypothetical protein
MSIYFGASSIPIFFIVRLLKQYRFFSDANEWTFLKELLSLIIILLTVGIGLYFMGFIMEPPADRWNLATFIDSCKYAFLVGIVPYGIFTLINYQHLFTKEIVRNFNPDKKSSPEESEELIRIGSQLKKEELSFYPNQLIYAESEGNYVVFFLYIEQQVKKKMIRNSISNIEEQLSAIPYLVRTHRAFIVNIKQVISEKGNTLGYHLKLNGVDNVIPVSRQRTKTFDNLLKKFR